MREYIIKIWEDEERRNVAESDVVAIGLNDMKDAIEKAKHIMALHSYESIEVQTQDEKTTVFSITPEGGEEYFHKEIAEIKLQDKINKYYDEVYLNEEVEIDSDTILGRAKDIIKEVENNPVYSDGKLNDSVQLLFELEAMRPSDVTKVFRYSEAEYYEVKPPNEVLENLQKSYLEHMKDFNITHKNITSIVEIYFDMNEITNLMDYGADNETDTMKSLSDLFTEILEELDIPIDDVFTREGFGDGKYETTIIFENGKEYSLDTKAWYTATEITKNIEDIASHYQAMQVNSKLVDKEVTENINDMEME